MIRRITFAWCGVVLLALGLTGCKSGSAEADEVLSERTKRAEASETTDQETSESAEGGESEEQGASENVIRLFDESEVDDSEGGDIQIESASEDSVLVSVDTSDCKVFEKTMSASLDKLETSCETDDDCTMLALPCAFDCGKPVAAYANLGQIEALGEQYANECPNCKKMCQEVQSTPAVCSDEGRCVAGSPEDVESTDDGGVTEETLKEVGDEEAAANEGCADGSRSGSRCGP